jgi:hypothetical protein
VASPRHQYEIAAMPYYWLGASTPATPIFPCHYNEFLYSCDGGEAAKGDLTAVPPPILLRRWTNSMYLCFLSLPLSVVK